MRKTLLALLLAGFAMPASAAPFLVCVLQSNNTVIVDFADSTIKIDDSSWQSAVVNTQNGVTLTVLATQGSALRMYHEVGSSKAYYEVTTPNEKPIVGEADCIQQQGN